MTSSRYRAPGALRVPVVTIALVLLGTACGSGDAPETTAPQVEVEPAEAETSPEAPFEAPEETEDTDAVQAEIEPQLSLDDLGCQSAQMAVVEAYRVVFDARLVYAKAIAAYTSDDSQEAYDKAGQAAVNAERVEIATIQARTKAVQDCTDVSYDVHRDHSRCILAESKLSRKGFWLVKEVAALHDSTVKQLGPEKQPGPEFEHAELRVESAKADIELAEARVERDCAAVR